MQRDPDIPGQDGYVTAPLIMESAKEAQEWEKRLPQTVDLPDTHEYWIENVREVRNGQTLVIKRVGVRRRQAAQAKPAVPADKLDDLPEGDLEIKALEAGLDIAVWKKLASKAKRVKAIREAKVPAGV